jgi:hypothetical protein
LTYEKKGKKEEKKEERQLIRLPRLAPREKKGKKEEKKKNLSASRGLRAEWPGRCLLRVHCCSLRCAASTMLSYTLLAI